MLAMKSQHVKAIAGASLLFILFQNFDILQLSVKPINQESRTAHAKELMGGFYKGSCAQKAEKFDDLHISIYNRIYDSLPKPYKDKAVFIAQTLIDESEFYDVDPVFIMAMIKTESSFNPKARGSFGEIGLMQIKPDTAEWIANKEGLPWKTAVKTLEDPVQNIRIGIAYVNYLRLSFQSSPNKYVSAYNMGARNVRRMYASEKKPKEYSDRIMKNYKDMYSRMIRVQAKPTSLASSN